MYPQKMKAVKQPKVTGYILRGACDTKEVPCINVQRLWHNAQVRRHQIVLQENIKTSNLLRDCQAADVLTQKWK